MSTSKQTTTKFPAWDADKSYMFKLTSQHDGIFIVPRESVISDEKTGKRRIIRLSPIEDSPFKDEQDEDSVTSTELVQFNQGLLRVSGTKAYLLNYLMAWDGNADKTKFHQKPIFQYKLVDHEKLFKAKAEKERTLIKIKAKLIDATEQELKDFLIAEYNYQPTTEVREELETVALQHADNDPEHVLKTFNTEDTRLKATIVGAFQSNLLKEINGLVIWGDTDVEVRSFRPAEGKTLSDEILDWIRKDTKEAKAFKDKLLSKTDK